jgi:amidase
MSSEQPGSEQPGFEQPGSQRLPADASGSGLRGLSIAKLRRAQESGELSAVDITREFIAEGIRNPTNAVVDRDDDAALAQARAVDDRRARGESLGPLAGIPLTIKDSFAVAGLRASLGTHDSTREPSQDAPAVARFRVAGAVLLGKSNVSEGLASADTDNDLYGRTSNPWDASRTPGGSSGGSAAAVAARLSCGDIGSDLSGSIRVPAAWCGVYGHRPSTGFVSKRGHLPWPLDTAMEPTVSAAGPLARSADDLRELFSVLATPDAPWRLELPASPERLAGLRVGLWPQASGAPIDGETSDAIAAFVDRLAAAGCRVESVDASALEADRVEELFARLVDIELSYSEGERAAPRSMTDVWSDWNEQRVLRQNWERVFDTVDVVISPVVGFAAPVVQGPGATNVDDRSDEIGRFSRLANLMMGPSTVMPIALGAETGMPIAVQALGRFGDDLRTIGFAQRCADAHITTPLDPALTEGISR